MSDPIPAAARSDSASAGMPSRAVLSRKAGRARLFLTAGLIGALWVGLGLIVRPIDQTCDRSLARDVCLETIDAALRRGLPNIHPLLLAAHAAPGPAARSDQFGQRATVAFDVLGIPGPISVRLFFDAGAHWGGIADRGAPELALWTVAEGLVAAGAAAAAGSWLSSEGRRPGRVPGRTRGDLGNG